MLLTPLSKKWLLTLFYKNNAFDATFAKVAFDAIL
jgi:hypothetical protein